ncbi:unnamed protein product [Miscanthus lutarioriparius]|uniref:WRKY domain-containing protein n=1 Tax=Miscanthus lutarioriparius TaxID=422564 RepID=A0A811QD60_9POAL|nr:unnamed protein product [Miscanthus lutarioriparius]
MACVADREAAVREVAQVHELIKLQQPLLLVNCSSSSPPSTQLAQSLLSKALRALNVALSVMKQQQPAAPVAPISVVKAEPQLSLPIPASADSPSHSTHHGNKRRQKKKQWKAGKKKTSSSWTTLTAVPYDNGYGWRKYGAKKINGTLFTRSYFRCTYKDDAGCLATKHVQQMDNSDPPMYHVTYNNDHTCSSVKANTGSSSSNLTALLAGCCGKGVMTTATTTMTNAPTGHAAAAAMNMKQEPPLLLPPLVEPASACFPYDQMPQRQEPIFPGSMEQFYDSPASDIPSATGSCISGETSWWDGYSGDMAAQMAAEDDPLHDLDRFLECDSFMDYPC